MIICKKCGRVLSTDTRFCGICGTAVDAPLKNICPNCNSEIPDGMTFCDQCGSRIVATNRNESSNTESNTKMILVIFRESQFQCATNIYKVIVNNKDLGRIATGKTLITSVDSDTVTVEIVCTTVMIKAKIRMVLRIKENARVSFKVKWPGDIFPSVTNAEILEQQAIY